MSRMCGWRKLYYPTPKLQMGLSLYSIQCYKVTQVLEFAQILVSLF